MATLLEKGKSSFSSSILSEMFFIMFFFSLPPGAYAGALNFIASSPSSSIPTFSLPDYLCKFCTF